MSIEVGTNLFGDLSSATKVSLTDQSGLAVLAECTGAGPNPPYISAITATTFDITIPASASAGATPSWNYLVVA